MRGRGGKGNGEKRREGQNIYEGRGKEQKKGKKIKTVGREREKIEGKGS